MHKITSVHDINTPMSPMCDRTPNWPSHPPREVQLPATTNSIDWHVNMANSIDWRVNMVIIVDGSTEVHNLRVVNFMFSMRLHLPLLVHQRLRLGSMVGELGAYTQRWSRFQITCFVDQKGIDNRPLISTNDIYTCRHNTTYSTTFARILGTIPVVLRRMKFERYSDDLDHQQHTTCVNLGMYGWRMSTRCPTDSSLRIVAYITNHYAMIANVCIQWKEIDRLW